MLLCCLNLCIVSVFVCVLQVVDLCWTGCIKSTGLARWAVSWQRTGTLHQKRRMKRSLLKDMRKSYSADRRRSMHTVSGLSWIKLYQFVSVKERDAELQGRKMTETDQTFTHCTYSSEERNKSITIILQYKINYVILASFVVYWEYFMSLKCKALALFKIKGVKYFDLSRTQKVTVKVFIM